MRERWKHRICERCWFDVDHPNTGRPRGVTVDDKFRNPVRVTNEDAGVCCYCGRLTIAGIFLREDPRLPLCQGDHTDLTWSSVRIEKAQTKE